MGNCFFELYFNERPAGNIKVESSFPGKAIPE
jgi:hypothetical protein